MQLDEDWLVRQGEDAALLRSVDAAFDDPLPDRLGIAISGGGDSMALLHLCSRWSLQTGHEIAAVTVDHGLRPESRAEARGVAQFCETLQIKHDILIWSGAGEGNIPAAARDARYALMADWAQANGVGVIALGHTSDDGAENFVMRLGRAAGLDGLAAMQDKFTRNGVRWLRPLTHHSRACLRDYLRRHDIGWVDDPSNDDPRYTRTKARAALRALEPLGIGADSIAHSANALRQSREALAHYTRIEAAAHLREEAGDIVIPQRISPAIPADIERRLFVAAVHWVGSNPYPPRKSGAGALAEALMHRPRLTVAGCLVIRHKGIFRITREYNSVKNYCGPTDAVWDNRWRLTGPHAPDLEVRALGEGLRSLPEWRETGLPRPTLMASPAVWRGETLVAAPLAGYNPDWSAQIVADFTSFLLSH
jgi:tRNA(Ile)-lysidine synthase